MDAIDNEHTDLLEQLAQLSARHIAEEGLSYGQAKRKAAKQAGITAHNAAMPSNEVIEQALREYLQEAQTDTQPIELLALRQRALVWLDRLQQLPHLNEPCLALAVGAVVNGTANEYSPIHIQVFVDDDKHLEMALLDHGFDLSFTEQTVQDHAFPVLVVQDRGIPVVLTLLPRSKYKAPLLTSGKPAQMASSQQLRDMLHE